MQFHLDECVSAVAWDKSMRLEDSPFRAGWWGTDLVDVGLEDVRPWVTTYGRYDFARLPPLPYHLNGSFDWLAEARVHSCHIGEQRSKENAAAFVQLQSTCKLKGVQLPPTFATLFSTPSLQHRIRSNTLCFLDLCPSAIPSPVGGGYLIRFLADSQGCIFWYVYLNEDGSDHAVVSSPDFYGTKAEQWNDRKPDSSEIVFSAESFESFLCRFWLENEIWLAEYENTPMPEAGRTYIERYKRGA